MSQPLVFIVEDDQDISASLGDLLTDEGYAVEFAFNGIDAVKRLQEGLRPNIIVLDLMMPGGDGFTALTKIHADPELKSLPVIVLSAVRSAVLPDGVPLLAKPIDGEKLLEAIEQHRSR